MAKKKDLNLLDYSAYISDDGLDKLKILEGHTKTEEVLNKETGKKEVTGLYGIKESAIKEVKRYAKEKGYDITEAMSKVKTPWDLTEETARDFAGYYAWRNHERADELTNNQFSQLTQHQKDVFLTYFHNMSLEKLSKNKGQKGSMLDALENGDTDEAIKRIFMKADGTISKYEDYIKKDRRGVANRNIATAEWLYNPNTLALQSAEERDKHYRDIYPNEDRIGTIVHGVGLMQDFKRQQRGEDMYGPDMMDNEEEWYTPLIEQNATRNATLLDAAYEIGRRIGNYIKGKTDANSNQLANSQTNMLNSENGELQ